jgi:hypothetical protein
MPAKERSRLPRCTNEEVLNIVKKLVDQTTGIGGKEPDPKAGRELLALVNEAMTIGDSRVAHAFKQKGADDILIWAAEEGHADLVKTVLKGGVGPKLTSMANLRPINVAAKKGRSSVIELLVQAGESPSYAEFFGKPAAIEAAEQGHMDAVRTLVRLGADVNARDETGGQTVLIAAAGKADAALVQLIVEKGPTSFVHRLGPRLAGSHGYPANDPNSMPFSSRVATV